MPLPTMLVHLAGVAVSVSEVLIDLTNLRDEDDKKIDWLPGDLALLDFDRPDVVGPGDWTVQHRSHGHSVFWHWLTPSDKTATFYLPTAERTEWRGQIVRNVQPAEVSEGSVRP